MKKIIKRTGQIVSSLLIVISFFFIFFTFTTTGLKTLIRISSLYFNQPINVTGIKGSLYNDPYLTELQYHFNTVQITLKNVHVHWRLLSLLYQKLPIDLFSAESIEIKQNDTELVLRNVTLIALITNKTFFIRSLTFNCLGNKVIGQFQIDAHYPYASNNKIKLLPATNNSLAGLINVGGDINRINWSADFKGLGTLSLQGTLIQLKQLEQTIKWRDLTWPNSGAQELLSKEGRITAFGSLPELTIQLASKINSSVKEQWQLTGEAKGVFPWEWNFNFNALPPYDSLSKHEGLYTKLTINGLLKNPYSGSLNVKIAPGRYQMPSSSTLSSLAFQGGSITANLTSKGVTGFGAIALDEYKKLNIQFDLPSFALQQGLTTTQKVSAELQLRMNSFDFLSSIIPEIKNPRGELLLSLRANGPLKKPNITTNMVLNKASLALPALGTTLDSINCTIQSSKDHWDGFGTLISANKKMTLKGQGLLTNPWSLEITAEGNDFPLINTQEYQVTASPKLKIKYNKETLYLTGTVLVPKAQIRIQSFSNSIGLSNDVVFERKEKNYSNPLRTQMDVQVQAGDEVEINAKGLHATLSGTVNIKQSPQSAMSATGELNVVEGEYKAYGQDLSIEQGELFFTGGAIDNPGINLRASKKINVSSSSSTNANQVWDFNNNNLQDASLRGNITAGVEVSGRLTEPEIQLFSVPAILSQADILSMLILGRPASQANKAGGQLLLAAISSMDLGKGTQGTQLLSQLKQNLGVDFNVETNSNYNLLTNTVSDKTAFVVSKSLSKRISIGYNVGLSQADPNVVTLKYLLNKFFSIQINSSSTSSGIDVLYTSSKK